MTGRIIADQITGSDKILGFIERDPVFHQIAEGLIADLGILFKTVTGLFIQPAADFFPVLRQIPMVDRHERRHMVFQTGLDQIAVKGDAFLVDRSVSVLDDARPGQRKTIGILPAFG